MGKPEKDRKLEVPLSDVLILVHAAALDGEVKLGEEGVEELKDVRGEGVLPLSLLFLFSCVLFNLFVRDASFTCSSAACSRVQNMTVH